MVEVVHVLDGLHTWDPILQRQLSFLRLHFPVSTCWVRNDRCS
jgi:hypothetical protein